MIVLKGNLEFHEVVNAAYAIVGWLYDLMFFLDGFGRLTCPKTVFKSDYVSCYSLHFSFFCSYSFMRKAMCWRMNGVV